MTEIKMKRQRRPRRKSTVEAFKSHHTKEEIRVESLGDTQILTFITTETKLRPIPIFDDALRDALTEMFGFLRSHRRPWRQQTVDIFMKHIKAKLQADFSKAMLTAENPSEIQALWNEIFPAQNPSKDDPKKGLRSA
jgi:hypothetical protein